MFTLAFIQFIGAILIGVFSVIVLIFGITELIMLLARVLFVLEGFYRSRYLNESIGNLWYYSGWRVCELKNRLREKLRERH